MRNHFLFSPKLTSHSFLKVSLLLALAASLSACNKDKEVEKNSQSIVRVNSDEITIHQVNNELQRVKINPSQQDAAEKKIVSGLIDRQILVQAAIKSELDRSPAVMNAIENSKLQILAQAYLEGKVSKLAKPTESEILDYRTKNPDIFENRKLYAMEELSFNIDKSLVKDLETLSNSAKVMGEVTQWLESHQIKFSRTKAVHAAETLPGALLNKVSKMSNGELIFINGPSKLVVAQLLETKSQPISVNDSKPLIERVLMNQKQKKAAEDEMNSLRKAAKIDYLDKKYEAKAEQKAANSTQSASGAAAVENKEEVKSNDKVKVDIEKGVSGL